MLEHTSGYETHLMVARRLTVKQPVVLFWEAFRVHGARSPRKFRSLIGTVLVLSVSIRLHHCLKVLWSNLKALIRELITILNAPIDRLSECLIIPKNLALKGKQT